MFKHILVGYDGSVYSDKALAQGIALAKLTGAEMTIVSAFARVPDFIGSPDYEALTTQAATRAQTVAQKGVDQVRAAGIEKVHLEAIEGGAAECMLSVADTRHCDCIVVGSHGHGQMAGLLLGSVSDRVAHHAKVPVLIVK